MKARRPLSPIQLVVHAGAWIPLLVLLVDLETGGLGINPYQDAQRRTGNIALILLILSLACTPLYTLFRKPVVLKLSRPLGLYAYMYAVIHLFIFVGLDYGFQFKLILLDVGEKRYILIGLASLILLSILALTSFRWWMRRMGKNWKRLHRLVYLINLMVVLHFAWAVKGDVFRLQGEVLRPLLAFVVIVTLLALRIPAVRRAFARRRQTPRPVVQSEEHIQ